MGIGDNIKAIRKLSGLTLEEFGKSLNASKGLVHNWEKGLNKPNKKRLERIAKKYNVTTEMLTGDVAITYNLSKVPTEQLQAELDKRKAEEQSEPVPLGPPCILRKW